MELLAISLGLWAAGLFLVLLYMVAEVLFWLLKPMIDAHDEKEWQKFRQRYYKENGRYPVIRHLTI